jgi:peptidyl-prolyl cis-trans isomerase B (cyclophilin B)
VRRRPAFPLALLVAAFALTACGDEQTTSTSAVSTNPVEDTADAGGGPVEGCKEVPPAKPKKVKLKPPPQGKPFTGKLTATVKTNCGSFDIALDTKGSPTTVGSFMQLVDEGVYDGTPFHRVVDGFVIQGGDPAGDGTGGPGYSVTEKPPADAEYTRGVVAMAKSGVEPPGTSGSQFFVVTAADAGLPADYAILGHVTGDEKAVDRIESLADPALGEAGGEPRSPVVIESIALS